MLESQTAPEVCPTGVRLVQATPCRPMQCVGDGVCLRGHWFDESAYFGECWSDEFSMNASWRFESGWFVGYIVVGDALMFSFDPLFLASRAVMARKVWASMARVMCRYQASYL